MKIREKINTEHISIKWKIFMFLLVFIVVLLGILWLVQIYYLDSFYKFIKTNEAERVVSSAMEIIEQQSEDAGNAIDTLAAENAVAIYVADTEGTSLYSAEYIPTSRLSSIPEEEFLRYYNLALENGGTTKIEFQGNRNLTFGERPQDEDEMPMENDELPKAIMDKRAADHDGMNMDGNAGVFIQNRGQAMAESLIFVNILTVGGEDVVLLVNTQITPVDATVNTLKIELTIISAFMILFSLVLALLMSKQFSKSIIQVNNSAKELAAGNFDIRFNGRDYREITELSNTLNFAADELGKTERLRRELIANVSHDLRTPLTMIIAYSEVMRDLPGENTPENVQVVIDEATRLTNLVNDMLDISKLQSGVMTIQTSVYNLTSSIQSVFERYNKLKEQDGYSIQFHYEDEVYICADEYKIFQVVYNLTNNAINYAGDQKEVNIYQKVVDNRVRIEIIDFGEGIAPEALPYVWDRYYKVDKTHKRSIMGTGLGLSIVKNILDLHHAKYGVESEVGKGSNFWFELPIVEKEV